jgi:NADPH-dependent 2,4-dienoyl-CoA reductase/sulfur reductase-like enzyme
VAEPIVIVGASLAGLRTAEALRQHGWAGPITLVGAESRPPYDRPPLSKQILTGSKPPASTALTVPEDLGAEWMLGVQATGVDLEGRTLSTSAGDLSFSRLVIATGATPKVLPPFPPGPGVHYLRTLDDSVALHDDLTSSRGLVVIGAGFIGLEVAISARTLDVPVVVLEALPIPLERGLGPDIGARVGDWHLGKGLDLRVSVRTQSLVTGSDGRPEGVRLESGEMIPADVVVVGVGVAPATAWLEGSGIDLHDGVRCDRFLRVLADGTPVPGVYAAGDVARWWHEGYGEEVRVEHWTNAGEAAEAVAANLVAEGDGRPMAPYAPTPYFWSDQHGVKLQFVGRAAPGDETAILEGSFEEDRVLVGYGRAGRTVAALGIRRPARVMALQGLIGSGCDWPPNL